MRRKRQAAPEIETEPASEEALPSAAKPSEAEAAARRKLHRRYLLIVAFLIAMIFVLPKLYGTGQSSAAGGAQPKQTASAAPARSSGRSTGTTAATASQRSTPEPTEPAVPDFYIGNKNSRIFHRPDCKSLPAEKNQVRFETRDEAEAEGFTPCARCNP